MLLAGLGIGALASQLGAVTVSALPDEQSGEVGGLQNTFSNLGISIGTALAGAILVSALTASFFAGIESNPAVPDDLTSKAQTELTSGVPVHLRRRSRSRRSTTPGCPRRRRPRSSTRTPTPASTRSASSLAVLAVLALVALFLSRSIPTTPVGAEAGGTGVAAAAGSRSGSVGHGLETVERAPGVVPLLVQLHELLRRRDRHP